MGGAPATMPATEFFHAGFDRGSLILPRGFRPASIAIIVHDAITIPEHAVDLGLQSGRAYRGRRRRVDVLGAAEAIAAVIAAMASSHFTQSSFLVPSCGMHKQPTWAVATLTTERGAHTAVSRCSKAKGPKRVRNARSVLDGGAPAGSIYIWSGRGLVARLSRTHRAWR